LIPVSLDNAIAKNAHDELGVGYAMALNVNRITYPVFNA